MLNTEDVPEPQGSYHDFWLCREGEIQYKDYWDMMGRKDVPVCILDDVLRYLSEPFHWVPTIDPTQTASPGQGLNFYGPTIINQIGGKRWQQICSGWAQILSQGPEPLVLTAGWIAPAEEEASGWEPYRFRTSRMELIASLEQLANYGRQAATGEYFLLHLGI